ncbi:MAG: Holliday junction branch migration protein RuvA [Magnetovibrio sp.]|nr:Holliday junction branch migration protein RuvA [Magnetovibrio sp.]
MISKLKGVIDAINTDSLVIDVNGVGYLVFGSSRMLSTFVIGDTTAIEIETHVREDHINLYGFIDGVERDWFRLLTTVQGVGAKAALGILGILAPNDLLQAIAANDKIAITRAQGIGPKLATRILSELKDKVGNLTLNSVGQKINTPSLDSVSSAPSELADAASALVNLGYGHSEALGAVARVLGERGDGVDVEELIREGLKELAGQ